MMLRKKKTRVSPISEINVVPYIDVMLVLLVIFMITAPILTQGITVDLPKTTSSALKPTDREPIIVSINKQGEYFLNTNPTPELPLEAKALEVKVAAQLALAEESHQSIAVLVKGDQGVFFGKVVELMNLLKAAGAAQVGFLTDSSQVLEEKNV